MHYRRFKRYGDTSIVNTNRTQDLFCTVAECDQPTQAKNLCRKHYKRLRKGIDLNALIVFEDWSAIENSKRCKWLYYNAKRRAKVLSLPFDLEATDIIIPKMCPILGIPLTFGSAISSDNSPAIDRIVPAKGYVKTNIQIISNLANRIKTNATTKQIRMVADYLEKLGVA